MADDGLDRSYAIVAIPYPDDYVWNLSSEKIPHLTLMYLGDSVDHLGRVAAYLQHVVDSSMCQFDLMVDRRGVLGDKSADVLFFKKWTKLDAFRSYLLAEPNIRDAYLAAEQFPTFTPHLTMGYPETPAKPDTRDWPGINSIRFDRIALWSGPYEGVEFPLKTEDRYDSALGKTVAEKILQHYGVKGMKWGVIHEKIRGNPAVKYASASSDANRAKQARAKAKVAGVHTLTNKDLQELITRMNLETQFKNLKQVEHEQSLIGHGKKWAANFVTDVLKDAAASWIRRPGSSGSGSRGKTHVRSWTTGQDFARVIDGDVARKAIGS